MRINHLLSRAKSFVIELTAFVSLLLTLISFILFEVHKLFRSR
jgi:hypothetical protein